MTAVLRVRSVARDEPAGRGKSPMGQERLSADTQGASVALVGSPSHPDHSADTSSLMTTSCCPGAG